MHPIPLHNTPMKEFLFDLVIFLALAGLVSAGTPDRMAWFREAKFGMFVHWGLYSIPAGEWEGKTNYGEWLLEETKMPVSQYEKFSDQFNPTNFSAVQWVGYAKSAGMKYLVITSKHHDGFCLWNSKLSDWSIARTPFTDRDPLGELAAECRRQGLRFGLYYSLMDWHHPDWGNRRAWNDVATNAPDRKRYVEYAKGQLTELITAYQPDLIWFDGGWDGWTWEEGDELVRHVRSLKPDIIVNDRASKFPGSFDYVTPEQTIPDAGLPGKDWESCMTMNDHWGYNKNDQSWKSTDTLVRNLQDCTRKGGNYLLNVGPTADGRFPEPCIRRLAEIGERMNPGKPSQPKTR